MVGGPSCQSSCTSAMKSRVSIWREAARKSCRLSACHKEPLLLLLSGLEHVQTHGHLQQQAYAREARPIRQNYLTGNSAAPAHLWLGVSVPAHSAFTRLSTRRRIRCRSSWSAGQMCSFRLCCAGSVPCLQGDLQRQLCSSLVHLSPRVGVQGLWHFCSAHSPDKGELTSFSCDDCRCDRRWPNHVEAVRAVRAPDSRRHCNKPWLCAWMAAQTCWRSIAACMPAMKTPAMCAASPTSPGSGAEAVRRSSA